MHLSPCLSVRLFLPSSPFLIPLIAAVILSQIRGMCGVSCVCSRVCVCGLNEWCIDLSEITRSLSSSSDGLKLTRIQIQFILHRHFTHKRNVILQLVKRLNQTIEHFHYGRDAVMFVVAAEFDYSLFYQLLCLLLTLVLIWILILQQFFFDIKA